MGNARLANRIHETTSTTGTGPYALLGAAAGFRRFVDTFIGAQTTGVFFYVVSNATQWEIGVGTVTAGVQPTLARDQIIQSSNGNAAGKPAAPRT